MKTKKTLRAIICNIIAWIFSAICLIPLLLILFNSLHTTVGDTHK